MKNLFLIPILLLVVFSCSPEEETQVPTNTVQTTTPELVLSKIEITSPPDSIFVNQEFTPNIIATFDNGTTQGITHLVKITSQNQKVTILNNNVIGAVKGNEVI